MNINLLVMKVINVLLVIALFWGCHRTLSEGEGEQEMVFFSNIRENQVVNVARASFANNTKVCLYIAERTDEEVPRLPASEDLHEMVCGDGGVLSFADGQKHYYPDVPIDIYGYYWGKGHVAPLDLTKMSVSVNADQSTPELMAESDFLYLKAANGYVKDASPVELEFNHLFSKLVINFSTETPSTIRLDDLEEVKVSNVVVTGSFSVGEGVLTNGETVDDIRMRVAANTSAIIFPRKEAGDDLMISFKFNGNDVPYEAKLPAREIEPGKEYVYALKVNEYPGMGPVEEVFLVSIKDWEQVLAGEVVVERGENVKVTLTDVVEGVAINKADLFMSSGEVERNVENVAVENNQMNFVFPRTEEGGSLQLNSACFYTEDGEKFVYYFTDLVLKGNNHDQIALPMPKVGDTWAGGTIFVVGKVTGYDETAASFKTDVSGINAYRGRVVADASLGNKAWCIENAKGKNSLVGADSKYDGMLNLRAVEAFAEKSGETLDMYPAFRACRDLGEGWYYPALYEIRWIALHKEELNVNIEVKAYGSSTEKSSTDYVGIASNPATDMPSTKFGPSEVWPVREY